MFGPPKTKRSRRKLFLGKICLAALIRFREVTADRVVGPDSPRYNPAPGQPDDLIFITSTGRVIEPRNVNRSHNAILKRAKIDHNRVHDLRHTCATLLLMDGATIREVMEQFGHASISTTANIYGHVLDKSKQAMADRMNKRAGGEA